MLDEELVVWDSLAIRAAVDCGSQTGADVCGV